MNEENYLREVMTSRRCFCLLEIMCTLCCNTTEIDKIVKWGGRRVGKRITGYISLTLEAVFEIKDSS